MKNKTRKFSAVIVSSLVVFAVIFLLAPVKAKAEEQKIVTNYADLWTSNITVKKGVPVKWYVNVPEGTEPKGCGATIKIPDLGFGTDTHNKNEGHIVLKQGENFIYEFTPETEGDILFICWMGSGCHYNYIHVTSDGIADPSAKTGGKAGTEDAHHDSVADPSKTASGSNSSNAGNTAVNPSTGAESSIAAELILILSAGVVYTLRKRR